MSYMFYVLPDTTLCIYRAWDRHKEETLVCALLRLFSFFYVYLTKSGPLVNKFGHPRSIVLAILIFKNT